MLQSQRHVGFSPRVPEGFTRGSTARCHHPLQRLMPGLPSYTVNGHTCRPYNTHPQGGVPLIGAHDAVALRVRDDRHARRRMKTLQTRQVATGDLRRMRSVLDERSLSLEPRARRALLSDVGFPPPPLRTQHPLVGAQRELLVCRRELCRHIVTRGFDAPSFLGRTLIFDGLSDVQPRMSCRQP